MAKSHQSVLSRDAFLQRARNLKRAVVTLDGIGKVGIRELTGRQMLAYNERIQQQKVNGADVDPQQALELTVLLLTMSICDAQGNLLFSEGDIGELSDLPFEALTVLAEQIMTLSSIDVEKAREVAANLKKALDTSTTSSPTSSENP